MSIYPDILCIKEFDGIIKPICNGFCIIIRSITTSGQDINLFIYVINSIDSKKDIGNICKKICHCCFEITLNFCEFNSATICETFRENFNHIFNYEFLPEIYNKIEKAVFYCDDILKCALSQ